MEERGHLEPVDKDEDLLRKAKRGDALAFERFVRRHDHGVRAMTARILDGLWVEDVLQEAYLKAYRALPELRTDDARVSGWLYRIAYRTAIDELRRTLRRQDAAFDSLSEAESKSIEMAPEDDVGLRLDILAALKSLSVEQRATVVLVDELGFDYQTAGAILDVPRGTIASRLTNARAALRRVLDDHAGGRRALRDQEGGHA